MEISLSLLTMYKRQHFPPSKCICREQKVRFLISGFCVDWKLDFQLFSRANGAILNAVCSLNDDVSDGLSLLAPTKKSRRSQSRGKNPIKVNSAFPRKTLMMRIAKFSGGGGDEWNGRGATEQCFISNAIFDCQTHKKKRLHTHPELEQFALWNKKD